MWSLPGFELQGLLGAGPTGEVWRAREPATGQTVALKRLHPGVRFTAVEPLDTPYVVRVREVLESVLVLDHPSGGSLAALLDRRGRLDPGEVVTVAAPLAQALAAAHRVGRGHGAVTATNVLFTADGMPLLADLGLTRAGEPEPAEDVRALAELCRSMLTVPAPAALSAAVEAGLVEDPARRPDAAAFSVLLRRAHPAAPVQLAGGGTVRAVAPRRPAQGVLVGAGLVALLLVCVVAGWLSGRGAGQPSPALPPRAVTAESPRLVNWAKELARLDADRADAFAAADPAALTQLYAVGSPGLAADTALVQALAERGQTAHGLRHEVRSVQVLEQAEATVRLRVVDVLRPYELRDGTGSVVGRGPGRGEQPFLVTLTRSDKAWRLVEVRPEPAP